VFSFITDILYPKIFDKSDEHVDEPLNTIFEQVGYAGTQFSTNIGSLLIIMLLFPISALVFKIGSKCCCKKLRKLAKKKFSGLVWNGII